MFDNWITTTATPAEIAKAVERATLDECQTEAEVANWRAREIAWNETAECSYTCDDPHCPYIHDRRLPSEADLANWRARQAAK